LTAQPPPVAQGSGTFPAWWEVLQQRRAASSGYRRTATNPLPCAPAAAADDTSQPHTDGRSGLPAGLAIDV